MDVSCPVVSHTGQHPLHPFGRWGYMETRVPQTHRDGTAVVTPCSKLPSQRGA